MNRKLEICCYSVESAILAEQAGADRIELCENFSEGGTTPSYATIKIAVKKLQIPVSVIIRPRGGDFLYSDIEYELVKEDVKISKELGVNSIVVGFLISDGSIDIQKTKEIVDLARPMEVTFHRAFDRCKDPFEALEQLIEIGVKRILTSGQRNKATEGIRLLQQLVEKAQDRIIIIPGSGVNDKNISNLISETKVVEYHSSAKTLMPSRMGFQQKNIHMGSKEGNENLIISVDTDMIKEMKKSL